MHLDVELARSDCGRRHGTSSCEITVSSANPQTAGELVDELLSTLAQPPDPDPRRHRTPADVYKGAVLSLASISGTWGDFQRHRRQPLEELLHDYDLEQVVASGGGEQMTSELIRLLPGQSQSANAKAVERWAELVANTDVSRMISELADAFDALAELYGLTLSTQETFVCLFAYLGDPPARCGPTDRG